mgnify:CR=1 FL=1
MNARQLTAKLAVLKAQAADAAERRRAPELTFAGAGGNFPAHSADLTDQLAGALQIRLKRGEPSPRTR